MGSATLRLSMVTPAPIESIDIAQSLAPTALWPAVCAEVLHWLDARGLQRRDAIVLLPFAELLPPCRQAFALAAGWLPRVETLRTLADTVGPDADANASAAAGQDGPSGDAAIDALIADHWLAQVPALRQWRGRDRAAYEAAVAAVVQAAQTLQRGAAGQPADARAAWWQQANASLGGTEGPGALDVALGRLALQWAQLSPAPASDRLAALRPAAWIVLQAGGEDLVAEALMRQACAGGSACLRLQLDTLSPEPFEAAANSQPQLLKAATAEDEAWACARAAVDAVEHGDAPVALIAQDRLLVRRVRALLERTGLTVADESGWALSTTRAAANLMALLRATRGNAGPDAWLDALKALSARAPAGEITADDGDDDHAALDELERHWRRHGPLAPASSTNALLARAINTWHWHRAQWQAFSAPARQSLQAWLQATAALARHALYGPAWLHDPAAIAVRAALRLDHTTVRSDVDALPMSLDDFLAWVESVLEQASFIAPIAPDAVQVVITPLARAMLRPFGAIVLPGADDQRLGVIAAPPSLLPEPLLRALGLADREQRERRATLAFVQLLRHPRLLLLRRTVDGSEHLGPSLWLQRLQVARQSAGLPRLVEQPAALHFRSLPARPQSPPQPTAAQHLPMSVSASAVEALRACPYRFFARTVLGLGEAEELETDPDKRDYGSLLHDALQRFHDERRDGVEQPDPVQRLVALALAAAQAAGLEPAALLPFTAGLPAFARHYLEWLAPREAEGWHYEAGEVDLSPVLHIVDAAQSATLDLTLRGRIDRIDRQRSSADSQLIDYKTGSLSSLRDKVKQPLEDTQLAFYAAQLLLSAPQTSPVLTAGYVALDERQGIKEVGHAKVTDSAEALLGGLATDWLRMRRGTPLQALGDGPVCDTCEARGLCRRDHWTVTASTAPGGQANATEPEAGA